MYRLPRHAELLRTVATYWEKDDHDCLKDDSWPGQKMGDLTFEEGQRIFRQQVPMGETNYRTFRWDKSLQVWLTDGRDFRSPNTMKDGPDKTIWGKEQKAWLVHKLKASDVAWRVIITPTPIVGPDRGGKGDNHANKAHGSPGEDKAYHKFHRVKGGFLSVAVRAQAIAFRHHDVHGKVVYEYEAKAG